MSYDPRPWPPCPKCGSRERAVGKPNYCSYCRLEFSDADGERQWGKHHDIQHQEQVDKNNEFVATTSFLS